MSKLFVSYIVYGQSEVLKYKVNTGDSVFPFSGTQVTEAVLENIKSQIANLTFVHVSNVTITFFYKLEG